MMRNTSDARYAVKTSDTVYASIIAHHRTLGKAYKSLVRHHKEQYKHHKFAMAQPVIAIIATEAPDEIIRKDIHTWATLDGACPQSKKRLPLPIVIHQWNPSFNLYIHFGAPRA